MAYYMDTNEGTVKSTQNGNPVPNGMQETDAFGKPVGGGLLGVSKAAQDQIDKAAIQNASQPVIPKYTNLLGDNNLLQDQFTIKPGEDVKNNLDTSALNKLQSIGMAAPGTSDWEQMMLGKQGIDQANSRDSATRLADTSKTQAYSDLATHGGLSTGARERLGRSAGTDLMTSRQGVARQGALDRLGIGIQGENNRLGVLSQLPGMQQAKEQQAEALGLANRDYNTGIQKTNIGNSLAEVQRQDIGKYVNYAEQMKAYAANKQADATANSGK